jgi:hypothetical protein
MGQRRAKNLLLSKEALNGAEDYARHHGTTLSRLVEDFLLTLPTMSWGGRESIRSPIVRQLGGAANYGPMTTDDYRDYLYGGKRRARPSMDPD